MRRRGTVLVMVMALLGVLFVTGIVFLTTMSFEAELISADRQRARTDTAVRAVLASVDSALRQGLIGAPGVPFGGKLDEPFAPQFVGVLQSNLGDAPQAIGEIPGLHNQFAPIEPHLANRCVGGFNDGQPCDLPADCPAGGCQPVLLWKGISDVRDLALHPDAMLNFRGREVTPFSVNELQSRVPLMIDEGCNGITDRVAFDQPSVAIELFKDPTQNCASPENLAVAPWATAFADADGDGVWDTVQFPLSEMGFSPAQIQILASALNPPDNPDGQVFIALRIVPHGGMVNLNESHPLLIASVLDFRDGAGLIDLTPLFNDCDPVTDPLNCTFHRPTLRGSFYPATVEEPLLRQRGGLLLPVSSPPSALLGNPFDTRVATGGGDMALLLLPPVPQNDPFGFDPDNLGFETILPGRSRFWPFSLRLDDGSPVDPLNPSDPRNSPPAWPFRMDPSLTFDPATGTNSRDFDRRHLLTTISHDNLLSRGGRVITDIDPATGAPVADVDLLEAMFRANQNVDCANEPVVFEYPNYPHDIPNHTAPGATAAQRCDDVCPASAFCRFHPVKGRLQLSLPWMDQQGVLPADGSRCEVPLEEPQRSASPCKWFGNLASHVAPGFSRPEVDRMIRLLHDAFFMLVRNAGGKYWEDIDCTIDASLCDPWGEVCRNVDNPVCKDGTNDGLPCTGDFDCPSGNCVTHRCHDSVTGLLHREALISRTAASLTANMIDYADADDVPTRVALRSFDFTDFRRAGRTFGRCDAGENADRPCVIAQDCPQSFCDPFPPIYVYGLERQPFITEVATAADGTGVVARAVEIFNPYLDAALGPDGDFDGLTDYWLVVVDPDGQERQRVALNVALAPDEFTVFFNNGESFEPVLTDRGATTHGQAHILTTQLMFENGWTLYLVRRARYGDEPPPDLFTDIVVDQFRISGPNIGVADPDISTPDPDDPPAMPPFVFAMQRFAAELTRWKAPLPDAPEGAVGQNSLGDWNQGDDPNIRPVEVQLTNTGSFTLADPTNAGTPDANAVAFPTTGSMLFLLRHANRSLRELTGCVFNNVPTGAACTPTGGCAEPGAVCKTVNEDLAFTTSLDRRIQVAVTAGSIELPEREQVDNGRMPVFDVLRRCFSSGEPTVRPCQSDLDCTTGEFCGAVGLHHADPADTPPNEPGGIDTLPWGLTVFDYFTTLPLANDGPFVPCAVSDNPACAAPDSLPRVDQQGLRVHGRINLNAAPWKVLAGIPMVPMEKIPQVFRDDTMYRAGARTILGLAGLPDDRAAPIGIPLAKSIAAYRELRQIDMVCCGGPDHGMPCAVPADCRSPGQCAGATGDYGDSPGGRGWELSDPLFRRGPGFLSIGELANIRHPDACVDENDVSDWRMDAAHVDRDPASVVPPDYVHAVARLAALSDWITVRSDVFTVYGTLRGEMDPRFVDPAVLGKVPDQRDWGRAAADVDSRAIRFQETVDRLPAFLGAPNAHGIGPRVVAGYVDVFND